MLQARTTSARLPAKSLLPVGGIPLAILCAKRLARGGEDVVLATSDDPSDDLLAALAQRAGVTVFRGDLSDVLSRFLASIIDLEDSDIVVRMTADNPVPDGDFVAVLVRASVDRSVDYIGTQWPEDGLPYGVGGEVFSVGALRKAALTATSYDREHVTPSLAASEGSGFLASSGWELDRDYSDLRCTIDTIDDYLAMARVFERVGDPVTADWRAVVSLLPDVALQGNSGMSATPSANSYGRIVLGTAQFGLEYGATNRTGCPSDEEFRAILRLASACGVTHLDTARGYGTAETRIGREVTDTDLSNLCIISKLAPLSMIPDKANAGVVAESVDASVFRSCHALQRRRIDVMLFHQFKDSLKWGGAALARLTELVEEGVVGEVGVSVYTPTDAIRGLADPRIQHIQIPFNLLDARWLSEDFQAALRQRPAVKIHVRSVFLQGLLINPATLWPSWFRDADRYVATISRLCAVLGRRSAADLCMAYVSAFPWVSTMVLGVERIEQLEELLAMSTASPLSAAEVNVVRDAFTTVPARLLNPSKW